MQKNFDEIRPAAGVDARWLTDVLHDAGVGIGNDVLHVSGQSIGTGQVGDNVRFDLTWNTDDPAAADLPSTVVGKFPSHSPVSRAAGVQMNTYQREVGFYRDLHHEVSIRAPQVFHVGWRPDDHDFVIVMEDISPAEQGDQIAGCGLEQAELAVDQAVGLHAPTWGRTDEFRHYDWLGFPDGERTEMVATILSALFDGFAERYAGRLSAADIGIGRWIVEHYRAWHDAVRTWSADHQAMCVIHSDYRLDNMLFGTGPGAPPLTVVDWQTVGVGEGPADLAYFCGTGMLPLDRETHERSLVERYAAGLAQLGVSMAVDDVWEGYALGSPAGYVMAVIASQVVEQTERGDEMFAVMAERPAAHMRHVELTSLI